MHEIHNVHAAKKFIYLNLEKKLRKTETGEQEEKREGEFFLNYCILIKYILWLVCKMNKFKIKIL